MTFAATVASSSRLTNLVQARARLTTAQIELLELQQTVERLDEENRELRAERASLVRDLTEWTRIAAARADRIVALEHRLGG